MFGLAALAVRREELVAALPLLRMRRRTQQCGLLRFLAIGLELTLHFGALARDVDVHARFKTEQQSGAAECGAELHAAAGVATARIACTRYGTLFALLRCRLHAAYTTYRLCSQAKMDAR